MPPSRSQHDPFTTTSTSAPNLRHQASHPSLRSTASAAPSRSTTTRQQRDFLAPIARRGPTGRNTPRFEADVVLADTDSASDTSRPPQQQRPLRRTNIRGSGGSRSPARLMKGTHRAAQEQEEIVNRGPNGSYFLDGGALLAGGGGIGMPVVATEEELMAKAIAQAREEESALARRYFTSGENLRSAHGYHGRATRRQHEEDGE